MVCLYNENIGALQESLTVGNSNQETLKAKLKRFPKSTESDTVRMSSGRAFSSLI